MHKQFDELTKSLAQSVTRRAALKKFGVGVAGMAMACFGLVDKARATTHQGFCQINGFGPTTWYSGVCMDVNGCVSGASAECPTAGTSAGTMNKKGGGGFQSACGSLYKSGLKCSFTI
jgi:hypothetical protein